MKLVPSAERSETPTVDGDEYVTMASAADITGIPVMTLRQWVDSGRLPARVGQRGRLVRLADVRHLVAAGGASSSNGAARPARAQTSIGNDNVAAAVPGNGAAAPGRTQTAAPAHDKTATVGPDKTTAAEAAATGAVESAAARQQRLAIVSNAAAFISKLDQLYRAQIAAKDGQIAAKDELIVELRRRAERAEQHAARLEQKLADLRAHAEVVETQPVPPASHPGLLTRIMSWYRRL
jgi:excisionase family DNA binding protein